MIDGDGPLLPSEIIYNIATMYVCVSEGRERGRGRGRERERGRESGREVERMEESHLMAVRLAYKGIKDKYVWYNIKIHS